MFSKRKTNLWKKDKLNFGRKFMKKLGWNKKDGLRKNGTGIVEPILPAQTHNKEAYRNSRWDYSWNWLSHQDDYTVLLSQLQQQHLTPSESKPSDISSVTDLEKKAKKSRKRVLYQRSIQGKNMKNCSEADWNCILGIKRRKKIISEEPDSTVETEECQDKLVISSSAAYSVSERIQMERRCDKTATSEIFHLQPENDLPTSGDSIIDNEQQMVQINSCSPLDKKKKKKKNIRKKKLLKQEASSLEIKSSQDGTVEQAGNERVEKENNCQAEDSLIVLRKAKKIKKRKKRSELKTILDLTNIGPSQLPETSSSENECIPTRSICRGILKTSSIVADNIKPAQKKCVRFLDKPIVGFVPAKDSIRGGAWIWRTNGKIGKSTIV